MIKKCIKKIQKKKKEYRLRNKNKEKSNKKHTDKIEKKDENKKNQVYFHKEDKEEKDTKNFVYKEDDKEDYGGFSGGIGGYSGGLDTIGTDYIILAWNDLGMHCMDRDYSVFAILPPYNTLQAQVIKRGKEPSKNVYLSVYYLAEPDNDGSVNTTSIGKTNFWDYAQALFGISLQPDIGLKGFSVPGMYPVRIQRHNDIYQAEGIPATPYDDDGNKDEYPLVKVVAKDLNGNVLASTTTVMPVSDEMTCIACHGSNSGKSEALPAQPENDPDPEKDYRWNILKKHDEKVVIPQSVLYQLQSKGYNYQSSLYQTAKNGTPILCSACHKSNALPGTGVSGVPPLTQAIHSKHAKPVANSGKKGRNACYLCHPGSQTQCLRGAMGNAHIECQNCHGTMADVGSSNREGWLDMPDCGHCHQNGQRCKTVFRNNIGGTLREVIDKRYSSKSLYRFSKGHGGIRCEACHGSPHAIYPSLLAKDNMQSIKLQGYKGTLRECFVCHKNGVPITANKGPHGLHTLGQIWVNKHGDYVEGHGYNSCKACHGTDLKGSELSEIKTNRTFNTEWGTKSFNSGHKIGCYDCHNGPKGD